MEGAWGHEQSWGFVEKDLGMGGGRGRKGN